MGERAVATTTVATLGVGPAPGPGRLPAGGRAVLVGGGAVAGGVGALVGVAFGLGVSGVAGAVLAVVAAVGAGSGLAGALRSRLRRLGGQLGGAPLDPVAESRVVNLVEGLCVSAGVRLPELVVVDSPGVNLAVVDPSGLLGSWPQRGLVAVTSGLLGSLSRVEMEGLLATAVVGLRHGEAARTTLAVAVGGPLAAPERVTRPDRDLVLDDAAVRLTRYPPGLASALRVCEQVGTDVVGVAPRLAPLWLAHPSGGAGPVAYRRSLAERIDALSEW